MSKQADERSLIRMTRTMASTADTKAQMARTDADEARALAASIDNSMKAAAIVFEEYVSITRQNILAVLAAPQVASFSIAKAKKKDIIFVHRDGEVTNGPPGGLTILVGGVSLESTGYVPADGTVRVYYSIPSIIVALGATLTIPLRIRGFRAS